MPKGIYFRSEEFRKKQSERNRKTAIATHLKYPDLAHRMGKSTQLKHPNQSSETMKRTNERLMKEDMEKYIAQRRNTASKYQGEKHPYWKGGCRTYYQKKARKIIERCLGRKLTSMEEVHHIDFNWKNNDITNLHLFKNMNEHVSYHNKLISFVWKELSDMNYLKIRCFLRRGG